jgi:epoxyqueuosine reductase
MSRSIQELQELTQNLPVNLIGISTADWSPLEEQLDASFGQWLSEGRQGSMEYLKRQLESKYHPQKMLSGAKSLVVCGLNYYQQAPLARRAADKPQQRDRPEKSKGYRKDRPLRLGQGLS